MVLFIYYFYTLDTLIDSCVSFKIHPNLDYNLDYVNVCTMLGSWLKDIGDSLFFNFSISLKLLQNRKFFLKSPKCYLPYKSFWFPSL